MKRFSINTEHYKIIEDMPDEDLGILFRAIFDYHINDQVVPPARVSIPFKLFLAQFQKDMEVSQARAKAGKTKPNKHKQTENVNQRVTLPMVERKELFKNRLAEFLPVYGKDMLNQFFLYWTEANATGKKMRFEMQKTWDLSLRLSNWARSNDQFKKDTTIKETLIPRI